MARPSIDQVRSLGDFATTVNWNLTFLKFPTGVTGGLPTSDALNYRCDSTDVPKRTGQSTTQTIRGHTVKQPGLYTPSGTLQLIFVETVDNVMSNFIRNWRETCYNSKTGAGRPKSECEAMIRIARLNRQDEEIWEYTFEAFLEDYDIGGQLQGASADLLKPTLTLSYDTFADKSLI